MSEPRLAAVLFIGCAVRRRRLMLGLTQGQLGERAKTKRPLVSRVECGAHIISIETLERYARALELRASELLREAEDLAAVAGSPPRRRGEVWV